MLKTGIYIIAAKRTPFVTLPSAFKNIPAIKLAALLGKELIDKPSPNHVIPASMISCLIVGNCCPSQCYGPQIAQAMAFECAIPADRPAYVVHSASQSGFQSIISGMQHLWMFKGKAAICAGVENMSRAYVTSSDGALLLPELIDGYDEEERTDYCLDSYDRWSQANDLLTFEPEICPVTVEEGTEIRTDVGAILGALGEIGDGNYNNPLAALKADGAAAVVLASEDAMRENNWTSLAKIQAYERAEPGQDASGALPLMGALTAMNKLLKNRDIQLKDIDMIEIHEGSAAQMLHIISKLDPAHIDKVNQNGGALAIGHPVAASGTRMIVHLCHQLRSKKKRYGIAAASAGRANGVAILLENMHIANPTSSTST